MDSHGDPQAPTRPREQTWSIYLPNGPSPTAIPKDAPHSPATATHDEYGEDLKKLRKKELCALSKTFGHIPDVPVFTHWNSRLECCNSAVHRSPMRGICGNKQDGVFSAVVTGLYEDNEDGGDVVIYTGEGGRERWNNATPPKRLRFGPQTMDQSWDSTGNQALMVSLHTGNPIRVVRSWRGSSQYSPYKGYRYDGLYRVAACWAAKGRNGKMICRCRLERLPGQPPIPVRPITIPASRRRRKNPLVSVPTPHPSSFSNTNIGSTPHPSSFSSPHRISGDVDPTPHPSSLTHPHGISDKIDIESETSTQVGEMDHDMKDIRSSPVQHRVQIDPDTLPRYAYNARQNRLISIPVPHFTSEDSATADVDEDDEEVRRVEDDITIVSADDEML